MGAGYTEDAAGVVTGLTCDDLEGILDDLYEDLNILQTKLEDAPSGLAGHITRALLSGLITLKEEDIDYYKNLFEAGDCLRAFKDTDYSDAAAEVKEKYLKDDSPTSTLEDEAAAEEEAAAAAAAGASTIITDEFCKDMIAPPVDV